MDAYNAFYLLYAMHQSCFTTHRDICALKQHQNNLTFYEIWFAQSYLRAQKSLCVWTTVQCALFIFCTWCSLFNARWQTIFCSHIHKNKQSTLHLHLFVPKCQQVMKHICWWKLHCTRFHATWVCNTMYVCVCGVCVTHSFGCVVSLSLWWCSIRLDHRHRPRWYDIVLY